MFDLELPVCPVSFYTSNLEPSVLPVPVSESNYELSAQSIMAKETVNELFTFPASVLGAVNTLSVLSVSVFPRSQSLPWSPDQSGPPWWSSALSAPPWCILLPLIWPGGLLFCFGGLLLCCGGPQLHLFCRFCPGSLLCRLHPGFLLYRLRPGFLLCRLHPGFLLCRLHPGFLLYPGFLLCRLHPGFLLCLSPLSLHFHMDLTLHSFPCSASTPPSSRIVLCWECLEAAPCGVALSRILSMDFCPLDTRGCPSIILTFTLHRLLHVTLHYISHAPFH